MRYSQSCVYCRAAAACLYTTRRCKLSLIMACDQSLVSKMCSGVRVTWVWRSVYVL